MVKTSRKRALTLMLVAGAALTALTGTAFAGGSTVHLAVPSVTVNTPYTIGVSGSATGTKHLYLFIDAKKCGRTPHVEFSRTGKFGTAYGYYWRTITGSFKESASFVTTSRIKDHACAYLSKGTVRKNSKKGVVARAFKPYTVT